MHKNIRAIGMPSNRDRQSSFEAIQSAAAYCKKTDTQFVVTDNSGDPLKEKEWSAGFQGTDQRYIKSLPCGGVENWTKAFNELDAEFVLMMGDDDRIFSFAPAPDFSRIGKDVVAIKPYMAGYTEAGGIQKLDFSPVLADKPHERIVENIKISNGANLGFSSFWRRTVLESIFDLWFNHHPTKAAYGDWAAMNGLMSSGKSIIDPSVCLFYNLHNWTGTPAHIQNQIDNTFVKSGLPAGSSAYATLFNAIDSYTFINRKDSPLDENERGRTALFCFNIYLQNYISHMPATSPHENANEIAQISRKLIGNDSVPDIFAVLSNILDAIQPDLGRKYEEYHAVAVGKSWGIF